MDVLALLGDRFHDATSVHTQELHAEPSPEEILVRQGGQVVL
jgi:hypothetical protein